MTEDRRDLRDPAVCGGVIRDMGWGRGIRASEVDLNQWDIPNVDPGESTVSQTVRQYREDLIEAARNGDRHAMRRLEDIDPAMSGRLIEENAQAQDDHPTPNGNAADLERLRGSSPHTFRQHFIHELMVRRQDFEDPDPGDADGR